MSRIRLNRIGLGLVRSGCIELSWIGLIGLSLDVLGFVDLVWFGLDWVCLACIEFSYV